jgi:hypothetical protein
MSYSSKSRVWANPKMRYILGTSCRSLSDTPVEKCRFGTAVCVSDVAVQRPLSSHRAVPLRGPSPAIRITPAHVIHDWPLGPGPVNSSFNELVDHQNQQIEVTTRCTWSALNAFRYFHSSEKIDDY